MKLLIQWVVAMLVVGVVVTAVMLGHTLVQCRGEKDVSKCVQLQIFGEE